MVMKEIVERVQFPDEKGLLSFDAVSYEETMEFLESLLQVDSMKQDAADTISEMKRRWKERKAY